MSTVQLVPFDQFDSCVEKCGPLYDANGGCTPPAVATSNQDTYLDCFCKHDSVSGLTGNDPNSICSTACSSNADAMKAVQTWFLDACGLSQSNSDDTKDDSQDQDTTNTKKPSNSNKNSAQSGGGNHSWIHNHWKWLVVMIVFVVVFVAGWILFSIYYRRRQIKKDQLAHRPTTNPSAGSLGAIEEGGRPVSQQPQGVTAGAAAIYNVAGAQQNQPAPGRLSTYVQRRIEKGK